MQVLTCGHDTQYQLGIESNSAGLYSLPIVDKPTTMDFHFRKLRCASAGYEHTLFIDEKGNAYAVGDNRNTRIEPKERTVIEFPIRILIDYQIEMAAAGWKYTIYITEDKKLLLSSYQNHEKLQEIELPNPPAKVFGEIGRAHV